MKPIKVTSITVEIQVTEACLKSRKLTKPEYKGLVEDILDRYANDNYFDFELTKE